MIVSYYGPSADVAHYRSRFERLNWWALIGGILMGYSSMATGCFRFADSYMAHNTAASGIFFITPLYMVVHSYKLLRSLNIIDFLFLECPHLLWRHFCGLCQYESRLLLSILHHLVVCYFGHSFSWIRIIDCYSLLWYYRQPTETTFLDKEWLWVSFARA